MEIKSDTFRLYLTFFASGLAIFVFASCSESGLSGGSRSDASATSSTSLNCQTPKLDYASQSASSLTTFILPQGDFIIVGVVANFFAASPSVTDDIGNTYLNAVSSGGNPGNPMGIWYAVNSAGGASQVAVGGVGYIDQVWVLAFSGMATSNSLNGQSSSPYSNAPGTVASAPTVNLTGGGNVVFSVISLAPGGDTILDTMGGFLNVNSSLKSDGAAYLITNSPGSYGGQWTLSGSTSFTSVSAAFSANCQ